MPGYVMLGLVVLPKCKDFAPFLITVKQQSFNRPHQSNQIQNFLGRISDGYVKPYPF